MLLPKAPGSTNPWCVWDFSYGSTDEHGYEAVENKMHIHDWHATILHLLGFDLERLTYRYGGREMRLPAVAGSVTADIIA